MKTLTLTSLLLLGTALVSLACASPATQDAPESDEAVVRNDVNESTPSLTGPGRP